MKITKNAKYDYKKHNISEEAGYTKWYDRTDVTIIRIIAIIISSIVFFVFLHIFRDKIKQDFEVPRGVHGHILFFCAALIMVFIVPLLWKTIQFVIASKGRPGQKCIINLKNPSASVYDEKTTRRNACFCLIAPGILFILLFLILTILTDGVQKTYFLLVLFRMILCTTDDIGTLWCLLKNVGKNDTVFGEYKR